MRIFKYGSIFFLVLTCTVSVWSQDGDPMKPLQNVVASKTAKFETVDKNGPLYKSALDAHDLSGALKLVGQQGSFKGTVDQLFEEMKHAGSGHFVSARESQCRSHVQLGAIPVEPLRRCCIRSSRAC